MHTRSETPDVKIFVSRRIDIDSVCVDGTIYIPMRCGAVFDKKRPALFPGDDTGENISGKRLRFCEFTVQYWAWKNARAEYYGLCHYRRYLSFSDRRFRTNEQGLVCAPILSPRMIERFELRNTEKIRELAARYDMIIPEPAPVSRMPLPRGSAVSVRELWEAHDGIFFDKKVIGWMFAFIDALAPEYSDSAQAYFAGGLHRGYNCYILRRPLFERLCQFQFPIMDAVEKRLDAEGHPEAYCRAPAYVGEMLFGIFLQQCIAEGCWKICERQLVLFEETAISSKRGGMTRWYFKFVIRKILRAAASPLFPLGSKRREFCKGILNKIHILK